MYDLNYRRDLNINKKIFLGTEIEVAGFEILKRYLKRDFKNFPFPYKIDTKHESHKGSDYSKWIFTYDSSIMQNKKGAEVISPISLLNPQLLNELYTVCEFLKKYGGYINEYCAAHIHVDFQIFHNNLNALKKFILIMSYFEPELNRFFAGEQEAIRKNAFVYARNITRFLNSLDYRNQLFEINDETAFVKEMNALDRTRLLNFSHASMLKILTRNTVELRSPNGSLNPVILENNIYTLLKIIEYCFYDNEWKNLYYKWKELNGNENRQPDNQKARVLSRTIFSSKEDIKYFDWQYEKSS